MKNEQQIIIESLIKIIESGDYDTFNKEILTYKQDVGRENSKKTLFYYVQKTQNKEMIDYFLSYFNVSNLKKEIAKNVKSFISENVKIKDYNIFFDKIEHDFSGEAFLNADIFKYVETNGFDSIQEFLFRFPPLGKKHFKDFIEVCYYKQPAENLVTLLSYDKQSYEDNLNVVLRYTLKELKRSVNRDNQIIIDDRFIAFKNHSQYLFISLQDSNNKTLDILSKSMNSLKPKPAIYLFFKEIHTFVFGTKLENSIPMKDEEGTKRKVVKI